MKIKKIRIQNFRSIRDATFEPSALCALIGKNNCGKSNVLKALNLVLGDSWPSARSVSEQDFYGYDTSSDLVISIWFDSVRQVRGDVGDPVDFSGICFKVTQYQRRSGKHNKGDPRTEFVCIDDAGQAVKILKQVGTGKAYPTPG